jgi:hypothetical protein
MSRDDDLFAMPLDELWRAHQMISQLLFERLMARHRQLDEKLTLLQRPLSVPEVGADDPMWTKASGPAAAGKPVKKPGNGAAKHIVLEKAES